MPNGTGGEGGGGACIHLQLTNLLYYLSLETLANAAESLAPATPLIRVWGVEALPAGRRRFSYFFLWCLSSCEVCKRYADFVLRWKGQIVSQRFPEPEKVFSYSTPVFLQNSESKKCCLHLKPANLTHTNFIQIEKHIYLLLFN